ncbi:MAG: hypothetical protein ABI611_06415 [Solirubrobacteraceae bacterium]
MSADAAAALGTLVARLEDVPHELVPGGHAVFHVLLPAVRR